MAMKDEDENEGDGGSEQFMRRPGHTYGRREAEFDENNDDEAEHVDATSTMTPQSTNANKKRIACCLGRRMIGPANARQSKRCLFPADELLILKEVSSSGLRQLGGLWMAKALV